MEKFLARNIVKSSAVYDRNVRCNHYLMAFGSRGTNETIR